MHLQGCCLHLHSCSRQKVFLHMQFSPRKKTGTHKLHPHKNRHPTPLSTIPLRAIHVKWIFFSSQPSAIFQKTLLPPLVQALYLLMEIQYYNKQSKKRSKPNDISRVVDTGEGDPALSPTYLWRFNTTTNNPKSAANPTTYHALLTLAKVILHCHPVDSVWSISNRLSSEDQVALNLSTNLVVEIWQDQG